MNRVFIHLSSASTSIFIPAWHVLVDFFRCLRDWQRALVLLGPVDAAVSTFFVSLAMRPVYTQPVKLTLPSVELVASRKH